MDIDWSKAPEGATHCRIGDHQIWLLYVYGVWHFWDGLKWSAPSVKPVGKVIPRPKAPEAEWVDGFPAGSAVKVWFNSTGAGYWEQGVVIAQDGNMTVVKVNGAYYGRKTDGDLIAPIRTKEQQQREELKRLIADHEHYGHDYVTDKIIAAGWTKP